MGFSLTVLEKLAIVLALFVSSFSNHHSVLLNYQFRFYRRSVISINIGPDGQNRDFHKTLSFDNELFSCKLKGEVNYH